MLSRLDFSPDLQNLLQLGLGFREEILLKYFLRFNGSGAMTQIIREGKTWSWLTHSKVLADLPLYFSTPNQVKTTLAKLTGVFRDRRDGKDQKRLVENSEFYPLEKLLIKTKSGTLTYFRPRPEVIKDLESARRSPMVKLIEGEAKPLTAEPRPALTGPAFTILQQLMELPAYDQEGKLFTNRFSTDNRNYTDTMKKAWKMIQDIYRGTFIQNRKPAAWFLKQYAVTWDEIQERFAEVKGDWVAVNALIYKAAHRFHTCFRPDRLPENKDKLPRSVTEFFYKMTTEEPVSMLMVLAIKAPDRIQEVATDRIYDALPEKAKEIGEEYKTPSHNAVKYWARLKQVVDWYSRHRKKLQEKDAGCIYWMPSLQEWLRGYLEFLSELSGGGFSIGNMGVGNSTWKIFIAKAKKLHSIEVNLEAYS